MQHKSHTSVINVLMLLTVQTVAIVLSSLYYSYKQQLHGVSNQVSDLTNRLQEMTELRDAETSQLKMALANSESIVQSLQQELQSNTTHMATKVAN